MTDRLVTVAAFNTPLEADIARGRLSEAGIASYLTDEALVGNFWALVNAVGGVKLQVAQSDSERAREVLRPEPEIEESPPPEGSSPAPPRGHWRCGQCGSEVDAGFEVCWKCGASRDGQADPNFMAEPVDDEPEEPEADVPEDSPEDWQSLPEAVAQADANPFSSPRAPLHQAAQVAVAPPEATERGDDLALRALRAAIIGLMLCPLVLNIVSVCFLVQLAVQNHPLGSRGKRHFYLAWLLNIVAVPLVFILRMPLSHLTSWMR